MLLYLFLSVRGNGMRLIILGHLGAGGGLMIICRMPPMRCAESFCFTVLQRLPRTDYIRSGACMPSSSRPRFNTLAAAAATASLL